MLQDNTFKPISRTSSWQGRSEALKRARIVCIPPPLQLPSSTDLSRPKYVALPAGLIRGALARIGLHGTVTTEITSLPHCMLTKLCSTLLGYLTLHLPQVRSRSNYPRIHRSTHLVGSAVASPSLLLAFIDTNRTNSTQTPSRPWHVSSSELPCN